MIHKLNVLFIALDSRSNDEGAPIYCRITYNGSRKDFAIGIRVKPAAWDQKKQQVKTKDETARQINERLIRIRNEVNTVIQSLVQEENPFDANEIVHRYLNPTASKPKSIEDAFHARLEVMRKQLGKGICKATLNHYMTCEAHVKGFLMWRYKRKDLLLGKLDANFLTLFEEYLRTEQGLKQVSSNKVVQRFRSVISYCVTLGWLPIDPLKGYKYKSVSTSVVYLSDEEIQDLSNFRFKQERLAKVRDMFLFAVYTGLHYKEAISLTKDNIVRDGDEKWLVYKRYKTDKTVQVMLLPQAEDLLLRLRKYCVEDYLLPRISNEKLNSYLKEVSDIVGLNKNLTYKLGRKTFASTILIGNNVPIAVVSDLLGHHSPTITAKHYAKVDKSILREQMKRIAGKSNGMVA
jgi:integrase